MRPTTIKLTSDQHGLEFRGSRRVRYVPTSLLGTTSESFAIREVMGLPLDANVRAPGDWPSVAWQGRELTTQNARALLLELSESFNRITGMVAA